jgi:hypothetical protein
MTPLRPSKVQTAMEVVVQPIVQILVGLVFLAGGIIITAQALRTEPHDKWLVTFGFSAAIGGALILPGIFTVVKPILVFVFPNGIPLIGGRRASDPPARSDEEGQ